MKKNRFLLVALCLVCAAASLCLIGLQSHFIRKVIDMEVAPKSKGGGLPQQGSGHNKKRFLVLQYIPGQGAGNHAHGLLSAHMLGDEFGRIVCVSHSFQDFHVAFEAVERKAVQYCPKVLEKEASHPDLFPTIRLLNYEGAARERLLRKQLASGTKIIRLVCNTYPRWPKTSIPNNYFFRFYQPKVALKQIMPYTVPPKVVVHLRKGDDEYDRRQGLNWETFKQLGKELPSDTYLITNKVGWYKKFHDTFGWNHPNWKSIRHSSIPFVGWDTNNQHEEDLDINEQEVLELWCDWYTMLTAEKVYHTHSDFSLSAVHWMNVWARTIEGVDKKTGKLELKQEHWLGSKMDRLVDRTNEEMRRYEHEHGVD